jgi:AcrR family transcriptional regulator
MQRQGGARARIHEAAVQLFAAKGSNEVSVTELAQAAGLARGTVYNHLGGRDGLFEDIAAELTSEMNRRLFASLAHIDDPAVRLAHGIRSYLRRAHEEPSWGRFIARFTFSNAALDALWNGPPLQEVASAVAAGRYGIAEEQIPAAASMIGGTVLSAMFLVLEGHRTWRVAGTDAAELALRALGIDSAEARSIASTTLPPLAGVLEAAPAPAREAAAPA